MSVPCVRGDAEPKAADFHAALRDLAPRGRARVDVRTETGEWAHSYTASVKVGPAPPPGPFAWYLADGRHEFRFIVFDLDQGRGDVERDADELVELLEDADIRYLICVSGPGRGLHVWVPVEPTPAAVVRALARAAGRRLPSLDISPLTNPRTGCVRPPGAPHRAGGWSTPVDEWVPITPLAAAERLGAPNDVEAIERLAVLLEAGQVDAEQVCAEQVRAIERTPEGPRLAGQRRPCDVAALLVETPPATRGHAHLARILVRLALARWSPAEVRALLERHLASPGLAHLRRQTGALGDRPRSADERATLLVRQWDRAVSYAATLRREEPTSGEHGQGDEPTEWDRRVAAVVAVVAGVREAIAAEPRRWSTQAGPADRRVLEYLLALALDAVTDEIEIDCRRLALATGMGRSTAARALGRLVLDGWATLLTPGEGQRAHRYRVTPQGADEAVSTVTEETYGGGGTQMIPPPGKPLRPPGAERERHRADLRARREIVAHDAFTHPHRDQPGLGRHVASTAAALSTGLYKVKDLARSTGYTECTTRRHLKLLQEHHIARRTSGLVTGRWRRTRLHLDTAARTMGAIGVRERRHRAYAVERTAYAWWLAELERMHTPGPRRRPVRGQGRLILLGAPGHAHRDAYPRDSHGRADHRAARCHLTMERAVSS